MKDQKIKAIIKYFADFFDSWDSQSKIAMLTFLGIGIGIILLVPFQINPYVLVGSVVGVLIFSVWKSNKISIEGHQEQNQQQLSQ